MSVAFLELIVLFSLRTFAPGESPEFQHFPSLCLSITCSMLFLDIIFLNIVSFDFGFNVKDLFLLLMKIQGLNLNPFIL